MLGRSRAELAGCNQRLHSSARPSGPGPAAAVLRPSTVCDGTAAQSGQRDKRSAKGKTGEELNLTPLELIERIAALIPPPRTHRHRYFGVLAPNSPHRAAAADKCPNFATTSLHAEGQGTMAVKR